MANPAHTILFQSVGQVGFGEVSVPDPEPGEVLVEVAYSLVSPGTEFRCLDGKQAGDVVFPFVPGYTATGVVTKSRKPEVAEGTRVLARGTERVIGANRTWGGHISHQVTRRVFPLPDGVDLLEVSLARLAAISRRGPIVCQAKPGETVAVIGLGPIGQLSARIFHALGCETAAFDLSPERVALCTKGGVEAHAVEGGLVETIRRRFPQGANIVVESTGVPAVLDQALLSAYDRPWTDFDEAGARVVVQGSYAYQFLGDYDAAFRREVGIFFPRDSQERDVEAMIDWVATGRISVRELIGKVSKPEEAAETYAALRRTPGWATVAFDWRG